MPVVKVVRPKGLLLTPELLRASYGLIITGEPFCHWGMPDKDDVEFRVMRMRDTAGDYHFDRKRKRDVIRISSRNVGTMFRLTCIMAHEAIHVAERVLKTVTPNVQHNKAFRRMADEVCDCQGYDRHDFADVE